MVVRNEIAQNRNAGKETSSVYRPEDEQFQYHRSPR